MEYGYAIVEAGGRMGTVWMDKVRGDAPWPTWTTRTKQETGEGVPLSSESQAERGLTQLRTGLRRCAADAAALWMSVSE